MLRMRDVAYIMCVACFRMVLLRFCFNSATFCRNARTCILCRIFCRHYPHMPSAQGLGPRAHYERSRQICATSGTGVTAADLTRRQTLPGGRPYPEAALTRRQTLPGGRPYPEADLTRRQTLPGGRPYPEADLTRRQTLPGGRPYPEADLTRRQTLPKGNPLVKNSMDVQNEWRREAPQSLQPASSVAELTQRQTLPTLWMYIIMLGARETYDSSLRSIMH